MIKAEKALLLCCCKDLSGSNCMLKLNRIKAAPPRRAVAERRRQKPRNGFCRPFFIVAYCKEKTCKKTGARRGDAAFMRFVFSARLKQLSSPASKSSLKAVEQTIPICSTVFCYLSLFVYMCFSQPFYLFENTLIAPSTFSFIAFSASSNASWN